MRSTTALLAATAVMGALLTACGGEQGASHPQATATVTVTASPTVASPTPTPSAKELADATAVARALKQGVASASRVITLTEDNDSNGLIGRPNGYVSAAVITDEGGDTSDKDPGVDYGATVEMFESPAGAARRSKYIQGILNDSPALGTEYDYVAGQVLLRVSGKIKPSVAKTYEAAFKALDLT